MNIKYLKDVLEQNFNIGFQVKYKDNDVIVTLDDSDNDLFYLKITISNGVRLSIICEPEKFGANFVNSISHATVEQKNRFVSLWNTLDFGSISIQINKDLFTDSASFINYSEEWKKFKLEYRLFPYIEEEHSIETICILIIGMMLSLMQYSIDYEGKEEGTKIEVKQNKYERNPLNRTICLYAKGYTCAVCGFNFEDVYGDIGKEFIHVHHTIPVSKMGDHYVVNPIEDLVPLCPNCHAMVHRKDPPYTVDEMKKIIKRIKE